MSQPATTHASPKYRFLGKLGEGGMAEVFLGVLDQAQGFRKLLVLKLLRSSLADDSHALAMLLDEARLAARLNHRNIVQTYDVGLLDDRHAIVMEFLEGAPLGKLRQLAETAGERLPLAESLHIVCEALAGLHYAHELKDFDGSPLGVVHRDFTPANVMVTLDGHVKVLDFGIAKARTNLAQTRTGTVKGTTRYLAREMVLGSPVDRRTDVYMAGAMLWQLVTGARPWQPREEMAILVAILESRLAPVRQLDPTLPRQLERIIERATDPEPSARHASAQELRDALLSFARDQGLSSHPDAVAALAQRLVGHESQALHRRLETQLGEPLPTPEIMLEATVIEHQSLGGEATASRIRPSTMHDRPRPIGRSPLWSFAAGLVAVGMGLVAALTTRPEPVHQASTNVALTREVASSHAKGSSTHAPGSSTHAAATPQALPVQATEPASDSLALHVEAAPRHAQLFLDGERISENPAKVTVRRDDRLHELRAEAPGYVASIMQTRFVKDAHLTLELRRERATKRRTQRRERAEQRAPEKRAKVERKAHRVPREAAPPARDDSSVRSIDTESPFR